MAFIPPLLAIAGPALAGAGAGLGSMFAGGAAAAGVGGAAAAAGSSLALGTLATGLSTAGGIFGAVQSYQSGMFQSKVANYNAQLAMQNEQASLTAGQNAEQLKRMQTGKEVGSEAAAQAAGGTDVGGGSNAEVRTATQTAGDFDALTIRYNAARSAYGYSQEAFSDMLQSKVAKQDAISGLIGGTLKAGGSFLSGASSLADKWTQYKTAGVFNVPTSSSSSEVPF